MPTNDPVLIGQIVAQRKQTIAPEQDAGEFFELFVAAELLKDHSLSYDELATGLIGGPNDGGVDGIWVFVNGDLVHEDSDFSVVKQNVEVELIVLQAKESSGFREEPINKLIAVTENLLDLATDLARFSGRYSEELLTAVKQFRDTYEALAGKFPRLKIRYAYATKGVEVHPNTRLKADDLRAKIPSLFSEAEPSFEFIGSAELLALARRQPKRALTLVLAESPISASGAVAYICLVRLTDFASFVTDESGSVRAELFEANVRDYQGRTEVNREIQSTLRNGGPEDFWWLNNGVSILASKATQSGKRLTIEDPQIVNGLQTSRQIFDHFVSSDASNDDARLILVRVIVPEEDQSRDRIIKATNSQTYIPPASLKATDKIQRDIEQHLKRFGIFYDRRKNHYKNQGRPVADIVGIPKMAQALMAIILARPDTARARPSSLIKKDADYDKLFSENHPIDVYLSCIRIVRAVESHLRTLDDLPSKDKNNCKFYIALELARTVTGQVSPSLNALKSLATDDIASETISSATGIVLKEYRRLGGTDQVAKGPDLNTALRGAWLGQA